ncbi:nitroreductase [Nocardioides flavus (ex Wang et al. 2016)]|uniref:Nitroreductase n=1 Tax=Nocardioides flavus (ex Wang et al. 2016) TaxID=2058780 RepID=A0ABQ3HKP5_9ACTN|nr:nitroreductase family protein [Nocardioides flavus (ex Wang et al. 2016)]GHE16744.1 nitroreductase [Nocardioides flavus (ex Wang et al. 2016)]
MTSAPDAWEVLYTTRAMRRMRPDPVSPEVQARIVDAAVRAPSGGDSQPWRFLLVDDTEVKRRLAGPYREAVDLLWKGHYAVQMAAAEVDPEAESSRRFRKLQASVQYLADHFEEVPLLLFVLSRNDRDGGSTFPAVWSAMLAARAQGVGSALTNVLDIFRPDTTKAILGVPPDRGWELSATVAMGYPRGRWRVAPRRPAHEVTYRNVWGEDAGFVANEPMWSRPEADR